MSNFINVLSTVAQELKQSRRHFAEYTRIKTIKAPIFKFQEISYNARDVVNHLPHKSSYNAYDISFKILKAIKNQIICPLTKLYNGCLIEVIFPYVVKLAKIIPIL